MDGFGLFLGIVGFIALIIFLSKVFKDEPPKESLRHPKLRDGVVFFSHECGNITWKDKDGPHCIHIKPDILLKHKALQRKVKEYITHTPLNTDIRITNYAWDLTDALELSGHLKPMWDPVAAYHFCNGVVMVRYMERTRKDHPPSKEKKDLYFAASDGHLIHFKS